MELSLIEAKAKLPPDVYPVWIPVDQIGLLTQIRGSIGEQELIDLIASIEADGQETPGKVVALTEREAKAYLTQINRIWRVRHKLSDFNPVFVKERRADFYFFLIAGHRRLAAVKKIGRCLYRANLRFGGRYFELVEQQYSENIHAPISPDDEARFFLVMWQELKEKHPTLSLKTFAKRFGATTEKVRKAVRFAALPVSVQRMVKPNKDFKKGIAYGLLCELARLQEARENHGSPYTDMELIHLAYTMVAECKTVEKARAFVSEQISHLEGQTALFDLTPDVLVGGARRTVATGLERQLQVAEQHFHFIAQFHDGGVPKIASGGAVSAVHSALTVARDLAPQIIEGVRGARGARRVREELQKV